MISYDLVELAEALDVLSRPHRGSAWDKGIAEDDGVPCTTPRQEAIIKDYFNAYKGMTLEEIAEVDGNVRKNPWCLHRGQERETDSH